jgi:hypothetical protein
MISGQVTQVYQKQWQDKTFYSLQLNDGENYGFGPFKPSAGIGDKVEFEAEKNPKGFWAAKKDTLKVTKGTEQEVTAASAKAVSKDKYWTDKETRDIHNDQLRSLGACRNTAIEWIKVLLQNEAAKLPAAAAKKEEALNHLLDSYVDLFMNGVKKEVKEKVAPSATEAEDAAGWN